MEFERERFALYSAIGLWTVTLAFAVFAYGIVGVTNPFRWLLAVKEFVEFIPWLLTGGDPRVFLMGFMISEGLLIVYGGMTTFSAAVSTMAVYLHKTEELNHRKDLLLMGCMVGWPVIGFTSAVTTAILKGSE